MSSSQGFYGKEEKTGGVVPEWLRDPSRFQRQLMVAVLSLLLLRLIIYFLKEFDSIFQPLFVAIFICYLIFPLHKVLVRWKIPSKVAFILILILIIAMFYGLGWVIYGNVTTIEQDWANYQRRFDKLVENITQTITHMFPQVEAEQVRERLKLPEDSKVVSVIEGAVGSFLGFFTWLLVILIYVVFLVTERESFPNRVEKAFGESRSSQVADVINSINTAISQYLVAKTVLSILTAVLTMTVLLIFGIDFVITWGLITFLFNFIPYIGSIIAGAFPVMLCFIQYPDQLWRGFVVAGCLFLIQQVIGNVIEPRYMGRKLHMSPLLIIIALSFWGVIWGVIGMILAVPILIIIQIIFNHIKETRPLAVLMSNQ